MSVIEGKWSVNEINKIKELYPKYGAIYLSKLLNRKKIGIINKASQLGIKFKKIKVRYHEEKLRPIIEGSKNLKECLEKMNIRAAGGNYSILNKYIKLYNISIEHFDYSDKTKNAIEKRKILIDDILVINSTYNRTNLKRRIIKNNLIEYKCKCGNKGEWDNKKLVLQLDHINGIYNDNRLENLRFLCPNCHSQTPTFTGKNKIKDIKDTKVICYCGNKMNKKSTMCIKCSNMMKRRVDRPEYNILIEDIGKLGYVGTSKKYGVSDNTIRKWIKNK